MRGRLQQLAHSAFSARLLGLRQCDYACVQIGSGADSSTPPHQYPGLCPNIARSFRRSLM
jgi:hypothetical protein